MNGAGIPEQLAHTYGPELNESPTTTPFQTRAASPIHSRHLPHSPTEAHVNLDTLASIFRRKEANNLPTNMVDGSGAVPVATKIQYLMIYLAFNLGLSLHSKAISAQFPYPFLLTALHAFSGFLGTSALLASGCFSISQLGYTSQLQLHMFSLLYTANIAISNVSLFMVTIPFHQIVRATTPVFTVLIYRHCFGGTYRQAIYMSLVPVITGVGFSTYGDYSATIEGFFITMLGAALAATKTVATNRLQTAGLRLGALELLYRMSPLTCIHALLIALLNGELRALKSKVFSASNFGAATISMLALNGLIAFGLNVVSFKANKKVGALTMTVAANVKQVMTIILAVILWNLSMGVVHIMGVILTIGGGAWYGYVSMGTCQNGNDHVSLSADEGKFVIF